MRDSSTGPLIHRFGCKLADALGLPQGMEITRIEIVNDWSEAAPLVRVDSIVTDEMCALSQVLSVVAMDDKTLTLEPFGEIVRRPMPKDEESNPVLSGANS